VVANVVVVGLFEEEEKGISIANDVVKVKGGDPATPGCLREDRMRRCLGDVQSSVRSPLTCSRKKPFTEMIPQYQFNKTK
jgi:hypothetical protein